MTDVKKSRSDQARLDYDPFCNFEILAYNGKNCVSNSSYTIHEVTIKLSQMLDPSVKWAWTKSFPSLIGFGWIMALCLMWQCYLVGHSCLTVTVLVFVRIKAVSLKCGLTVIFMLVVLSAFSYKAFNHARYTCIKTFIFIH